MMSGWLDLTDRDDETVLIFAECVEAIEVSRDPRWRSCVTTKRGGQFWVKQDLQTIAGMIEGVARAGFLAGEEGK